MGCPPTVFQCMKFTCKANGGILFSYCYSLSLSVPLLVNLYLYFFPLCSSQSISFRPSLSSCIFLYLSISPFLCLFRIIPFRQVKKPLKPWSVWGYQIYKGCNDEANPATSCSALMNNCYSQRGSGQCHICQGNYCNSVTSTRPFLAVTITLILTSLLIALI